VTPVVAYEIHFSLYWSNGIRNLQETHSPNRFNVITDEIQTQINWLCSMDRFTVDIHLLNNGIYYYFCICTRYLKWEMGVLHNSLICVVHLVSLQLESDPVRCYKGEPSAALALGLCSVTNVLKNSTWNKWVCQLHHLLNIACPYPSIVNSLVWLPEHHHTNKVQEMTSLLY
jgi:hypothetical protein